MTKKDYVQFARLIRARKAHNKHLADSKILNNEEFATVHIELTTISKLLADILQADNSQFNRDKFLKACELPVEPS